MKRCMHAPMNRAVTFARLACLLSLFGWVTPLAAQDSHAALVTAPLLGDDDIGFQTINCDANLDGVNEPQQIKDAWEFLFTDIRGPLMTSFRACLESAELVEASCSDLQDHSRVIDELMADRFWVFECAALRKNVNGHSDVGIRGTNMQLSHSLLKKPVERIASVMAHELMHNRGYTHEANPLNSFLYDLTVSEQVEACVLAAAGSRSGPNVVSDAHTDARSDCSGSSWCDANGCFHTSQVPECGTLAPHLISDGIGYYCYDFPAAENCIPVTDTYVCFLNTYDQAGNIVRSLDVTPPPAAW